MPGDHGMDSDSDYVHLWGSSLANRNLNGRLPADYIPPNVKKVMAGSLRQRLRGRVCRLQDASVARAARGLF